jgi:GTP-binding protein HflX
MSEPSSDLNSASPTGLHAPEVPPKRAILVSVQLPDSDERSFQESLDELGRLAETLGLSVAGRVTQRRGRIDAAAYLGTGKLTELETLVKASDEPTVVLLDHEVSPSQSRNVQKAVGAHSVLDRTALILEIFHRHARSRQAKLQVELVRAQYMAPRLRENQKLGDRVRGGIGGKGAGESQLELDRRKLRDRIAELRGELAALDVEGRTRSARRQGLRRVALCGYTNAGKSTLFRALTESEVYVADKLFATLDTTVRALHPAPRQRILLSDTIGFIRNLPTQLVASFKSTLDEALEAGLILHVVDSADPACLAHIETTRGVLREIGAGSVPELFVFNKCDKLVDGALSADVQAFLASLSKSPAPTAPNPTTPDTTPDTAPNTSSDTAPPEQGAYAGAIQVSAKNASDVARVRQAIIDFFDRDLVQTEIFVPYSRQELRGVLYANAEVTAERFDEQGVFFSVRIDQVALARLRASLKSSSTGLLSSATSEEE